MTKSKILTPVPTSRPPFETPIVHLGWRDMVSVLEGLELELRDAEQCFQNQATWFAEQARLVNKNPLRMRESDGFRQQAAEAAQRCVRCGELAYEVARLVKVVREWPELGPSATTSTEKVLISERYVDLRQEARGLTEKVEGRRSASTPPPSDAPSRRTIIDRRG